MKSSACSGVSKVYGQVCEENKNGVPPSLVVNFPCILKIVPIGWFFLICREHSTRISVDKPCPANGLTRTLAD